MTTATQLRQAAVDLASLAQYEIDLLDLDRLSTDLLRDTLIYALPLIADKYGSAAAALSADWYDDMRFEAGVGGRFRAVPAQLPTLERFEKLAVWAIDPLFRLNDEGEPAPDAMDLVRSKVNGGIQRVVMDQSRLTIVNSTQIDPDAKGWKRIGVGHNCDFCNMLISRGAVYSGSGVTFRSHDRCNCSAAPTWDENVRLVTDEPYRQSKRRRSDSTKAADNKRARAYMESM